MGTGEGADGTNVVLNGNSKTAGGAPQIFATPIVAGFMNFAVAMDFDKKYATPDQRNARQIAD